MNRQVHETIADSEPPGVKARVIFMTASCFCLFMVIYGSFLPLEFERISWVEAKEQFQNLRWLNLSLYQRSDWVANGLLTLVPTIGFCATVDYGHATRWRLALLTPIICTVMVFVVVGIEFFQAYFPRRTQSQNDVFAGIIGVLVSPMVYLAIFRPLANSVLILRTKANEQWFASLAFVAIALSVLYGVMPLDAVFTADGVHQKASAGRIQLFTDWDQLRIRGLLSSVAQGTIIGMLLIQAKGIRAGVVWTFLYLVIYEALQFPIYSRDFSVWSPFIGAVGIPIAAAGMALIRRLWAWTSSAKFWISAGLVSLILVVVLTLSRSTEIVRLEEEVQARWQSFWAIPFAKYYSTSEFSAGVNCLAKIICFATPSYFLTLGVRRLGSHRLLIGLLSATACIVAAFAIEITQIYVRPHIPDITDVITYLAGCLLGMTIATQIDPFERTTPEFDGRLIA